MRHSLSATPEDEVLLLSVHLTPGAEMQNGLRRAIKQVLHWPALLAAALRHGIFPSFYRTISQTCPELVPPGI